MLDLCIFISSSASFSRQVTQIMDLHGKCVCLKNIFFPHKDSTVNIWLFRFCFHVKSNIAEQSYWSKNANKTFLPQIGFFRNPIWELALHPSPVVRGWWDSAAPVEPQQTARPIVNWATQVHIVTLREKYLHRTALRLQLIRRWMIQCYILTYVFTCTSQAKNSCETLLLGLPASCLCCWHCVLTGVSASVPRGY